MDGIARVFAKILFFICAGAEFGWRHRGCLFENAHKVNVAFVSAVCGDCRNFLIRQCQKVFCVFDAAALNIRRNADAEKLLIKMLNIG